MNDILSTGGAHHKCFCGKPLRVVYTIDLLKDVKNCLVSCPTCKVKSEVIEITSLMFKTGQANLALGS